jgi:hypothetical protein
MNAFDNPVTLFDSPYMMYLAWALLIDEMLILFSDMALSSHFFPFLPLVLP